MCAVWLSVLLSFLASYVSSEPTTTLTLGTWNIQNYGNKKSQNDFIMKKITQIISKHEIISVQELSDKDGKAIDALFFQLRKDYPQQNYGFIHSPYVGEGGYGEQYGVFYSKNYFKVEAFGTYPGPKLFKRSPYCVTVSTNDVVGISNFGLCTIHTAPDLAISEISNLADVADWYRKRSGIEDIMILGDFNCGCDYVKQRDYEQIELYTRPEFRWLVSTCADTTVRISTNCAYDRIVVAGPSIFQAILAESADVFNYQNRYSLNNSAAESISDHFPVNLKLKMRKAFPVRPKTYAYNMPQQLHDDSTPSISSEDQTTSTLSTNSVPSWSRNNGVNWTFSPLLPNNNAWSSEWPSLYPSLDPPSSSKPQSNPFGPQQSNLPPYPIYNPYGEIQPPPGQTNIPAFIFTPTTTPYYNYTSNTTSKRGKIVRFLNKIFN